MAYPSTLEIAPLTRSPHATVRAPGSKSITNRALVLAALAAHSGNACRLTGALRSEDTEVMLDCLCRLGFTFDVAWPTLLVHSSRLDRPIPASAVELYVANSGTTMRFLTALVAAGRGRYRLDGVPRMRERPIGDLLGALGALGVTATSAGGYPPVVIDAAGLRGGRVTIRGDVSSQFLSGLLMAAPLAEDALTIEVAGPLVSTPYVRMTVEMLWQFGAAVEVEGMLRFHVPGRQTLRCASYAIEPDASAASYLLGVAAVTGGAVTVTGLPDPSLQGDVGFVDLLERMGCMIRRGADGITVHGRPLHGIDVDMNDISDTVMTLAAVACFAEGPTTIRNVAHIRHKETDRLVALATELRRVGADVDEFADGLTITPRPLHGSEIETYNDHRMAMSMALIGLRVPGIIIKNPGCVAKTYPGFFDDLEKLR